MAETTPPLQKGALGANEALRPRAASREVDTSELIPLLNPTGGSNSDLDDIVAEIGANTGGAQLSGANRALAIVVAAVNSTKVANLLKVGGSDSDDELIHEEMDAMLGGPWFGPTAPGATRREVTKLPSYEPDLERTLLAADLRHGSVDQPPADFHPDPGHELPDLHACSLQGSALLADEGAQWRDGEEGAPRQDAEEAQRAAEEAASQKAEEEAQLARRQAEEAAQRQAEKEEEGQRQGEEEARRQAEEEEDARRQADAEEAQRFAAEEEKREAEEAARCAAAAKEEATVRLRAAISERQRDSIEETLLGAQEHGVNDELMSQARDLIRALLVEEMMAAAVVRLANARREGHIDELRLAIDAASEAGVERNLIDAATVTLEAALAMQRRRIAASKGLKEATGPSVKPLGQRIEILREALREAHAADVPASETEAAEVQFGVLAVQLQREQAQTALADAFAASDVKGVEQALQAARQAGVEESEVSKASANLEILKEDLSLARGSEELLKRRIEQAIEVRDMADAAATSEEVMALMRTITIFVDDIEQARQVKLVKEKIISQAEAVVSEATADLKRIHAEKKQQEARLAQDTLEEAVELARATRPLTVLVLDALRQAIASARSHNVDLSRAEAAMHDLEHEYQAAVELVYRDFSDAIGARSPTNIQASLEHMKHHLLLDITESLSCTRNLVTEELISAKSASSEQRAVKIGFIDALMGILRHFGELNLRQLHNEFLDLKGALRVFCRVRPLNTRETTRGDSIAVTAADDMSALTITAPSGEEHEFHYDAVFHPGTTQAEVFAECTSLVQSAFDGYNVTIFSYGQTGAGKTWTLYGSGEQPGISPRTCGEVFQTIERDAGTLEVVVKASMVELYCNDLRDLLAKGQTPVKLNLKSVRNPDGSVHQKPEGLTETEVRNSDALAGVVMTGLSSRKVKATNMNADSSRSHLMLIVSLEVMDVASGSTRNGKITIVDLAGSERLSKSGVTGEGQKEAIEINKSLTALGDVMMALTSGARVIPYRNHKLTQLMQDSLGGTAKTLMFVNVSPSTFNAEESICALKYASRARCIENDVRKQGRQ